MLANSKLLALGRVPRSLGACGLFVLATVWLHAEPVHAQSGDRPNIVLVMADDLGWSDIGCYGGEIPTPQIDSLARDGVRFTQFYNNSICGPTRASLLTGLYCQQVGHRGHSWNDPKDHNKCVIISELLAQSGYRTMMIGKWQGRQLPAERGFERFFGPMCQGKVSYFHEVQRNPFYLDRERWQLPDDFYLTESFNDYAEEFLADAVQRPEPFFLYVAHLAPHWPLHAREQDIARHRNKYRQLGWDTARQERLEFQQSQGLIPTAWPMSPMPQGAVKWESEKHPDWQAERMAVYAAQVEAIDRGLGRLLKVLRDSGKDENTLVLFLSDNGAAPDGGMGPSRSGFGFGTAADTSGWRTDQVPIRPGSGPQRMPGPHDTFAAYGLTWATVSNTPLRGTKMGGYEGGVRTPLVARWPKQIQARGKLCQAVGHVMDFVPTFLELAGAEYPTEFQGRHPLPLEGISLRAALTGTAPTTARELCWTTAVHHAIRSGKWKAVRPRKGGAWELFDLDADGTESNNLAQTHPDQVEALDARFSLWQQRVGNQ